MEYLPVWPTYIGEKWEDFGQKHKGLKRGGIGNTLGEHIESLGKPSMVSIFFFCDGLIKWAHCKKKNEKKV